MKRLLFLLAFLAAASSYAKEKKQRIAPEKQFVLEWLNQPEVIKKYGGISDAIWSYAELGLQEFKSSQLLVEHLEKSGFTVEKGLAGMPTCFVASYGSGKPVIGILCEYDALPMLSQKAWIASHDPLVEGAPGHGCGHNTMAAVSLSTSVAIKHAMEKFGLAGTIKLFGSPAEETLISRPFMVRAGLFRDVDVILDNHAGGYRVSCGVSGSAMYSVMFTFRGKTAHGGSAWDGRSALDAVEIMNVATNYLREHLHFSHRMHYVITEGGEAPNVVPDKAVVWYYLRNSDSGIEDMYNRVLSCAKGAAMATGTLLETKVLSAIHQKHSNKALAELIQRNMELTGPPTWTEEEQEFARKFQKALGKKETGLVSKVSPLELPSKVFTGGASTDVGEVSLIAPTATLNFPSSVPGVTGHHWSAVACGTGPIPWKGLNAGAKALSATAIDLLTQPVELEKIRNEFTEYSKEHPYKSFLPEEALPPLDLNERLMNMFRPLMEKFYLEEE